MTYSTNPTDACTIAEIGAAICELECLEGIEATARIKELRRLTQQLPFMPDGKAWRADTYSQATMGALRVVQIASDMGLGRSQLHELTSQFQSPDFLAPLSEGRALLDDEGFAIHNTRGRILRDGFTRPTMAETALSRSLSMETFSIYLERTVTGQTLFRPGWESHGTHSTSVLRKLPGAFERNPEYNPQNLDGKSFADSVFASAGADPRIIAILEIKASDLIRELSNKLWTY